MLERMKNIVKKRQLKDQKYFYLFEPCRVDEYVCFDCETTGLNPKVDDIISIGAVIIKKDKILLSKKFKRFVKQTSKIPKNSIKIHQIRHCDVDNGHDIDSVIEEFLHFIKNRPLVGYNLAFDINMVNKYIKPKIGTTLPNKKIEVSNMYHKTMTGINSHTHIDLRFDSIMKKLDLPMLSKHNAMNDAIMTSMIFLKLRGSLK